MAPTTCRGFSAASAAGNVALAVRGAGVEAVMMPRSLRLRSYLYDRATGHLAIDVGLERTRQIGKGDGSGHDAVEVARPEIARDALPHLEPFRALRRGGIDAQQVHAAQDEGHDRGLQLRAAGQPDAGDVPPEIHVTREARQHVSAHAVDGAAEARRLQRPRAEPEPISWHDAGRA